jgi:peptide/nickel transport system substrate-binding protein
MTALLSRLTILACASIMLFASFALTGCSHNDGTANNTLVVIEGADAVTLNPMYIFDASSAQVSLAIFDPLAQMSPNYHLVPWLATSWSNTPDHLHWTIHLRKGVAWSDGAPFNAADVVWTWQTYLNPAAGYVYYGQVTFIKHVSAPDPYTVRFDLAQPNALFPIYVLNSGILPKHILGKYPASGQRRSGFGEHPIGTGPYMLDQWQHDDKMTLVRNPHWWHGMPKIPRILIRIVFVDEADIEAIKNGEAQLIDGIGSQDILELRGVPNVRIVTLPNLYVGQIVTNLRRPGLNDNRVLQAMMYGWDRTQVARGLDHGNASVATGIEPPALPDWYDPNVRLYPYDPARSRAILDAAGWRSGRDGVRRRDGVRLAFTYITSGRDGAAQDSAAEFQSDMRDIGIAISVQSLDWSTFLQKENNGEYDLLTQSWGGTPDPDQFTFLDSSQFPPDGNNVMFYRDPQVDRDLREGLSHVDPQKRKMYYDDFQRRIAEHLPFLFSVTGYTHIALATRVHMDPRSMLPNPFLFYNIGDWSLSP